jgi:hypothetical protein
MSDTPLTPEQKAEIEAIWAKRLPEIEAEVAAGTFDYEIAGPFEELIAKMERYADTQLAGERVCE